MKALEKDTALKPDVANKKASATLGYNASVVVGGSDPLKFVPNINVDFQRKQTDEFFVNINAKDVVVSNEIPVISDHPHPVCSGRHG